MLAESPSPRFLTVKIHRDVKIHASKSHLTDCRRSSNSNFSTPQHENSTKSQVIKETLARYGIKGSLKPRCPHKNSCRFPKVRQSGFDWQSVSIDLTVEAISYYLGC
ncbi:hypothetical protein TNCV_1631471 [Trichonephila clavipes]|nr:hypothetical protein TNCV_1631471 [Trichonephila clavipes]